MTILEDRVKKVMLEKKRNVQFLYITNSDKPLYYSKYLARIINQIRKMKKLLGVETEYIENHLSSYEKNLIKDKKKPTELKKTHYTPVADDVIENIKRLTKYKNQYIGNKEEKE
jgi:cation transport regulator ChaC